MLTGERGRLSEIVEQAPFQVMVLRGPGLLLETMNPPLAALFHTDSTANRPFDEICTDLALEPVRIGVRRAFVEGRPWYSEWLRVGSGDGERYYQFSGVPTHEQEGKVDGVVLYAEDVTDRRLHEEAEKLSKIRLMLDHANQLAMGLFDAEGHLVHASQQYLAILDRLCHVAPSSAVGQHWSRLWFGSPEDLGKFEQVVRTASPERLPEVRAGAGEQSVWDCTLIPIAPESGRPPRLRGPDVRRGHPPGSRREALEQVNRLKDTFLAMASHELRTPLTPLTAYVEVLAHLMSEKRRDADWEHQVSEVVSKFRRQITYMSRLTEDLVDISRIRSGHLALERKPVDLKRIVEDGRDQAEALRGPPEDRARRARIRPRGERGRGPPDASRLQPALQLHQARPLQRQDPGQRARAGAEWASTGAGRGGGRRSGDPNRLPGRSLPAVPEPVTQPGGAIGNGARAFHLGSNRGAARRADRRGPLGPWNEGLVRCPWWTATR